MGKTKYADDDMVRVSREMISELTDIDNDLEFLIDNKSFNETGEIKENFNIFKKVKKGVNKTAKKAKKGADSGLSKIMSSLKKILSFFKKIGKFFESVKKAFTFSTKKGIAVLLTIVVPFIGQIIGRIMILGGSLDKPWLLLFGIPPLTIIPALAMMFKYIKPVKGGKPWDLLIWGPILISIFVPFALERIPFFDGEESLKNGAKMLAILFSFVILYWYKSGRICKKRNRNKNARFSKIAYDSMIAYIVVIIMGVAMPYIPYIGSIFTVIKQLIPGGDIVIKSMGIFIIYVISNMINGSSRGYCSETINYDTLINLFMGCLALSFFPNDAM
jgi:hypothetical protein